MLGQKMPAFTLRAVALASDYEALTLKGFGLVACLGVTLIDN